MKKIVLGLLFVFFLLGVVVYVNSLRSTVLVRIDAKNVEKIEVFKALGEGGDSEDDNEPVETLTKPFDSVRLNKNQGYLLVYRGASGYASGEMTVGPLTDSTTAKIKPYYSEETLKNKLAEEFDQIQSAIINKYEGSSLYKIQPGKLYRYGEWYGTTMTYSGPPTPMKDTLRIVLEKNNGRWVVRTDPPYISLSKYIYKDVPDDVLSDVNMMPVPKIEKPPSTGAVIRF